MGFYKINKNADHGGLTYGLADIGAMGMAGSFYSISCPCQRLVVDTYVLGSNFIRSLHTGNGIHHGIGLVMDPDDD